MKKASIAILVVLALLIGLVAGFYSAGMSKGSVAKPGAGIEKGDYKDTFADGWRAAKEKLETSNFFGPAGMNDNKFISGTVKEIGGDKLVVETYLRNPLDDEALKIRNVSVSGAKFKVRVFKPFDERKGIAKRLKLSSRT
jgi:hypothetical protein